MVMPYEYLISMGECSWGDVYIHDYRSHRMCSVRRRKLIGSETDLESEVSAEVEEEKGGEIIAFESKTLDYINERQYHGLVGMEGECDSSSRRKRRSPRRR